jgi:hypothetical protein
VSLKLENIKKLMGWCPVCKKAAQQTKWKEKFTSAINLSTSSHAVCGEKKKNPI